MKYSKVREKKRNKLRLTGKAFFQKAGSKLIRMWGNPREAQVPQLVQPYTRAYVHSGQLGPLISWKQVLLACF